MFQHLSLEFGLKLPKIHLLTRVYLYCQVVVIAHRLQQTRRFDKIVVMGNGKVIEEGAPTALLEDRASMYSQLWQRAGLGGK